LILVFLFLIIGNVNAQTLFKLWGSNGKITQGNPKTSYYIKMDTIARGNLYHKNTQVTKYLGNAILPAQLFFYCPVVLGNDDQTMINIEPIATIFFRGSMCIDGF